MGRTYPGGGEDEQVRPGSFEHHVGQDSAAGVDGVLAVLGGVLGARQQRLQQVDIIVISVTDNISPHTLRFTKNININYYISK